MTSAVATGQEAYVALPETVELDSKMKCRLSLTNQSLETTEEFQVQSNHMWYFANSLLPLIREYGRGLFG